MYAVNTFLTAFLGRYHGMNIRQANNVSAIVLGAVGVIGLLGGGWAADRIQRVRADGRLHLSIPGPVFDPNGSADERLATQRATQLFPDLPPPRWEFRVAGWVGMSGDQYPHIHRLADGVIAAIGLSGRGIAAGTLLGADVSRRLLGLQVRAEAQTGEGTS